MLVQRTAEGRKQKKKQKTRKQRRRQENKKETDQDTIKTTAEGPAIRTLELLFLLLIAIPMQSIKEIAKATKTSWHYLATGWRYLTDTMLGGGHTTGVPPGGAETAETGDRVKPEPKLKLNRRRKPQTKMGKTSVDAHGLHHLNTTHAK